MLQQPIPFKLFRQFNTAEPPAWLGSRSRLDGVAAQRFFDGDSLQDRLVRALAVDALLPIKEILECGEMFERVRRTVRAAVVADLCCGHGLLGLFFALFERKVHRVLLVDRRQPPSFLKILHCIESFAPWVGPKVTYLERRIDRQLEVIPIGASVVSAHACGVLTDRCLDVAIETKGAVAVMPCCYPRSACPAPESLQRALGLETAFDVARTYRLEEVGYSTHWSHIPAVVTPMHRILLGRPDPTAR